MGIKMKIAPGSAWLFPFQLIFSLVANKTVSRAIITKDTQNVLTAAGFHQYHDTLIAYYGEYTVNRRQTHLWAKTSTDGEQWSEPIDMHVAVNPNHGPQPVKNGRLIISGNFTFPYTDDRKRIERLEDDQLLPGLIVYRR